MQSALGKQESIQLIEGSNIQSILFEGDTRELSEQTLGLVTLLYVQNASTQLVKALASFCPKLRTLKFGEDLTLDQIARIKQTSGEQRRLYMESIARVVQDQICQQIGNSLQRLKRLCFIKTKISSQSALLLAKLLTGLQQYQVRYSNISDQTYHQLQEINPDCDTRRDR